MSPNPAQTQIQFDLKLADGDVDLVIYDSNGMQIHAQKINYTKQSSNIEKLASGVYFINVYEDNSIVGRKKIVIQH